MKTCLKIIFILLALYLMTALLGCAAGGYSNVYSGGYSNVYYGTGVHYNPGWGYYGGYRPPYRPPHYRPPPHRPPSAGRPPGGRPPGGRPPGGGGGRPSNMPSRR
jgi:hypothetical protein